MIRDPSDGSVREPQKPATRKESLQVPVIETATSGLPLGSSKPENIAKLEKSREWLKGYRAGKIKPQEPDNAQRGSNEQEYPPAGNCGEQEGQAES